MKKFNLFNEIIITNKKSLLQAINSSKVFGINIHGDIKYAPFDEKEILIYEGKHTPQSPSALSPSTPPTFDTIFGKNYQIVEDDERVLIKAFSNWQTLIGINTPRASYDDTTGDGVAEFSCKDLETIGWHATEFNINYRTLVEHLEEHCEGTLLCIEQEEPYQFSGLGFLSDDKHATDVLYTFCQTRVKKLLKEEDDFIEEELTDDEEEAARFFKAIG